MLKFTFVVITSVPLELQRVLTTRFEGLNELYKLRLGPKFLNGIFIVQFWCAQMSKLSKYCQHSISKSKPKLAWVPVNYCYTQQNWMNDTKFSQIRETFSYKLSGIYGPLLIQRFIVVCYWFLSICEPERQEVCLQLNLPHVAVPQVRRDAATKFHFRAFCNVIYDNWKYA